MKGNVIKDTLSNYGITGLQVAMEFIAIPLYIGLYGQTLYGVYLLSLGLASTLVVLEFGSSKAVMRYAAEYMVDGESGPYSVALRICLMLTGVAVLLVSGALISIAFLQGYIFNIDPAYATEAFWLFAGAAVYSSVAVTTQISKAMLSGAGIFHERNKFTVFEYGVQATTMFAIWYAGLSIYWLIGFKIVLGILSGTFDYLVLNRRAPKLLTLTGDTWPNRRAVFESPVFNYAKDTFSISIIGYFAHNMDRILISIFLPVSFVTVYEVLTKPYVAVKTVWQKLTFVPNPPLRTHREDRRHPGPTALRHPHHPRAQPRDGLRG